MLGIYKGYPAIYDRTTGKCVVIFHRNAKGWQKAIKLAQEIRNVQVN